MIVTKENVLTEEQQKPLSEEHSLPEKLPLSNGELTPEQKQWLTNEFWQSPNWLVKSNSTIEFKNYHSYFEYNLQTRYLELEGEFRNIFNNNYASPDLEKPTAGRIVYLLQTAKKALEDGQVNLENVADILDIIERYMIWLYPLYFVEERIRCLADKILTTRPVDAALINKILAGCDEPLKLKLYRDVYDRVTGDINKENINNYINYGLQIERLQMLRLWGVLTFSIILLFSPLLMNTDNTAISGFHSIMAKRIDSLLTRGMTNNFPWLSQAISHWVLILTLAIFGCIGGFISGLLQIRNSRINLLKYRESLLKFQLKPLVGGVTAALIAVLLSWNILPGIQTISIGTFVLIAFLAGFSERYFLKLITIDEKNDDTKTEHDKSTLSTHT